MCVFSKSHSWQRYLGQVCVFSKSHSWQRYLAQVCVFSKSHSWQRYLVQVCVFSKSHSWQRYLGQVCVFSKSAYRALPLRWRLNVLQRNTLNLPEHVPNTNTVSRPRMQLYIEIWKFFSEVVLFLLRMCRLAFLYTFIFGISLYVYFWHFFIHLFLYVLPNILSLSKYQPIFMCKGCSYLLKC